jgi:hypothetical protein
METISNNIIAIAIVSFTVAMLVIPSALANRQRLTFRERLVKNAFDSINKSGGKRRRYTPEEDTLILSKVISDDEICAIIQRSKNSVHVRRSILLDS